MKVLDPFGYASTKIVELDTVEPTVEDGKLTGTIDALDVRYGSLWTNIPRTAALEAGIYYGDTVQIQISNNANPIHTSNLKNMFILLLKYMLVNH